MKWYRGVARHNRTAADVSAQDGRTSKNQGKATRDTKTEVKVSNSIESLKEWLAGFGPEYTTKIRRAKL
jgi:hypothetical protein